MTSLIQYSRDNFYSIKKTCELSIPENIKAIFDQIDNQIRIDLDCSKKVDKIDVKGNGNGKSNWRIIRKNIKAPPKTKEEEIINEINSYLNKISNKNFSVLSEKIIAVLLTNKNLIEVTIDNIFQKAVYQPTYCKQYVILCNCFIENNMDIGEILNEKCKIYDKLLDCQTKTDCITTDNISDYDKFCDSIKEKSFKTGFSQFIGELFNNNLINMEIVENNIKLQLNSLTNLGDLDDEFIENTIICLCQLIKTTRHKINMTNFMTDISKLIDMGILSKRLKFKLLDIKDLCSK